MSSFEIRGRILPDASQMDFDGALVLLCRNDGESDMPETAFVLCAGMDAEQADLAADFLHDNSSLLCDLGDLAGRMREVEGAIWEISSISSQSSWFCDLVNESRLAEIPDDLALNLHVFEGMSFYVRAMTGDRDAKPEGLLPDYDYTLFRRKVMALRAADESDRKPYFEAEFAILSQIAQSIGEGGDETGYALGDMADALNGSSDRFTAGSYSVVLQTVPWYRVGQFSKASGAWRHVVIAHGLSFEQAVWVSMKVNASRETFVDRRAMVHGDQGGEDITSVFIVEDIGLDWASVDLIQRRSRPAYEAVRLELEALNAVAERPVVPVQETRAPVPAGAER